MGTSLMTDITDQYYRTMFSKILAFSLLIGAVTAQLKDGVYRILDPEINSIGYVAKSGYEIGTPVTLGLSRLNDLHELVSFLVSDMLIKLALICYAYSG